MKKRKQIRISKKPIGRKQVKLAIERIKAGLLAPPELVEHIAYGNTKLDDKTAIFNTGAAADCISRILGLCKIPDDCYADKPENQYDTCIPYRRRQEIIWKTTSADDWANEFIAIIGRKRNPVDTLRFCESGDLWGIPCFKKMRKIAGIVLAETGIVTYTYTARTDLYARGAFQDRGDLIMNGSAGMMLDNRFQPVDVVEKGSPVCNGSKKDICGTVCRMCAQRGGFTIQIPKH